VDESWNLGGPQLGGRPLLATFLALLFHSGSLRYIFPRFVTFVVESVCYVEDLLHICFLLSFIESMVETKMHTYIYIIINSLFQSHLRHSVTMLSNT
jgi:hypothetical protein